MLCPQVLLVALLAFATAQDTNETAALNGRIVGGWETSITHFPHQVSLQRNARHICGGTIIAPSLILTAAHCLQRSSEPTDYFIRAGSTLQQSGGTLVRVRRLIPHSSFNQPTQMNNDIALLLLQQPLDFSSSIQPISLVLPLDIVQPQAQLFVSGWGATSTQETSSTSRLRYTALVQLDRRVCSRNYFGAAYVTSSMFCTTSPPGKSGRDSCVGDSGGPLVVIVAGRFKLLGIVSWGLGCANAQYPGVYTSVPDHANWLSQQVSALA